MRIVRGEGGLQVALKKVLKEGSVGVAEQWRANVAVKEVISG